MGLEYELSHTKQQYRESFGHARVAIFKLLDGLRSQFSCPVCDAMPHPPQSTDGEPEILQTFHAGCGYRDWQRAALEVIESNIAKEILIKLNGINEKKNRVTCHQCGVCCRLASSEFSYAELLEKAAAGDDFAKQFTSVFLPYASVEAARAKFPELVSDVMTQVVRTQGADQAESVYFYHCPYIGEDNRCTIYGQPKRPAICASYPDTPLTFIYDKCAWKPWKDETHADTLMAHAMIELCSFTLGKIKDALLTEPAELEVI